jgi:hypothetical protein
MKAGKNRAVIYLVSHKSGAKHKESMLLGPYDKTPANFLYELFPEYHITDFRGIKFYDARLPEVSAYGLEIHWAMPKDDVIEKTLRAEEIEAARRPERVSIPEIQKILYFIEENYIKAGRLSWYKKKEPVINELENVLLKYLKIN